MLEVARGARQGTVKISPSQKIVIDGAVFKVESVDTKQKKFLLGVLNEAEAKNYIKTIGGDNVHKPELKEAAPPKELEDSEVLKQPDTPEEPVEEVDHGEDE